METNSKEESLKTLMRELIIASDADLGQNNPEQEYNENSANDAEAILSSILRAPTSRHRTNQSLIGLHTQIADIGRDGNVVPRLRDWAENDILSGQNQYHDQVMNVLTLFDK